MGSCFGSMGNCFRSHRMSSNIASTREPLLRETERDAVTSLLQYLEQDSNNPHKTISDDKLRDLCTLAYSDNVDLQRSAALCFSELSEKCKSSSLSLLLSCQIR
ncbi:Vacuolar protein 8 [Geodia barretti]|uniref:Vacuolar protein 8 n=1 Tax=Geodia barretti TaxID=519541 RepID=A0AA35QY18_GEOBA|nr:Vacuolar protein 8 [Geodia barretti]